MRWLALALALCATQASALSCLQPDPVRAFNAAETDEADWIVVQGQLIFDETQLPHRDVETQHLDLPATQIPALLRGTALTQNGFTRAFDREITLEVQCFAVWCGGAASNTPYLAFLKREKDQLTAYADPCGGKLFPEPARKDLNRVTACFQGKRCVERPGR
ncbi:MAG: hypothetical protein N4A53_07505 [Pelagimonas sp.]|jgi:hypothetical protein|nr:hypothetical protein [Pelagimonas sp.]